MIINQKDILIYQLILVIFYLIFFLTGCKKQKPMLISVPTVETLKVIQMDVPIYSEWTATTDGLVNATIRAQVQGYLIRQNYKDGDFVKKGQLLFEIDPRPFEAILEQAKGHLAQQEALWETAKADLRRIKPLTEKNALSKKDLDDAIGKEQAFHAAVIAAKAAVEKAQLDLSFTKITSPIDGIAGIAKAQIGNLVGPGYIEELTTVSTLDPIKVYIPFSEQEYLKYFRDSKLDIAKIPLQLILSDGSLHPYKGSFAFADRHVDLKTGTIRVTALFPNPKNILRPGQFVRVRAQILIKKGTLLVPQRAVMEILGTHQIAIVTPENIVQFRTVKTAERINNLWVIDEGIKPGETVLIEGWQKVQPGMKVNPKPFSGPVTEANKKS